MARRTTKTEITPPKVSVGFIGLGAMGAPMATRLLERGVPLTVWNRTESRAKPFARLGAKVASTPAECAAGADLVITMVSDEAALKSVYEGSKGLLAGLRKKARWVDMSTVGRPAALRASAFARTAGARFADAPVSGTVGPAERGELVAFLGARVGDLPKIEPILSLLCSRVLHVGDVGQGQAMKVVVNTLGAHHFVAFASMLVLGQRAGLTREMLIEAFTSGAFASPSYLGKKHKVAVRDFTPEFTLALALKDVKLGEALGQEVGMDLPVVRDLAREIEEGVRRGLGEEDFFALEKAYEKR